MVDYLFFVRFIVFQILTVPLGSKSTGERPYFATKRLDGRGLTEEFRHTLEHRRDVRAFRPCPLHPS